MPSQVRPMGEIILTCPNCQAQAVADAASLKGILRCPSCGLLFLPEGQPAAPTAPALVPPVIAAAPAAAQAPAIASHAPSVAALPPPPVLAEQSAASQPTPALRRAGEPRRQPGGFGPLEVIKVVVGGVAGLGIAYLLIFWIQNRSGDEKPRGEPLAQQAAAKPAATPDDQEDRFPEIRRSSSGIPAIPTFTAPSGLSFGPSAPAASDNKPEPHADNERSPAAGESPAPSQPAPASPPAPAPSQPQEPLAGLADALRLPPIVDTQAAALSPLHLPEGKSLDVSFNVVAANIPEGAAFIAERQEASLPTWDVCFVPSLSDPGAAKRILAHLTHENGELRFAWRLPIEDAEIRQELANCLLRLTCENTVKLAALRAPLEMPRLALDLNRDTTTHELAAAAAPKEEALRLEIAELRGFPAGAKMEKEKRVVKLKERATIQFDQMPGAEIHVDFRRSTSGPFQVVFRPEFHENAADKFSMTLTRLAGLRKGLEKSIPEGEAEIKSLTKQLKALDSELRGMGRAPGGAAFVAWQTKRVKLESAISSGKRKISRLQRTLPEMKARLSQVPHMEQFLRTIQSEGSLVVRIVAECGDGKIVLAETTLDPPSGAAANGS